MSEKPFKKIKVPLISTLRTDGCYLSKDGTKCLHFINTEKFIYSHYYQISESILLTYLLSYPLPPTLKTLGFDITLANIAQNSIQRGIYTQTENKLTLMLSMSQKAVAIMGYNETLHFIILNSTTLPEPLEFKAW